MRRRQRDANLRGCGYPDPAGVEHYAIAAIGYPAGRVQKRLGRSAGKGALLPDGLL